MSSPDAAHAERARDLARPAGASAMSWLTASSTASRTSSSWSRGRSARAAMAAATVRARDTFCVWAGNARVTVSVMVVSLVHALSRQGDCRGSAGQIALDVTG